MCRIPNPKPQPLNQTLPVLEPGMGNIIQQEGGEVHGVAFQVQSSQRDFVPPLYPEP